MRIRSGPEQIEPIGCCCDVKFGLTYNTALTGVDPERLTAVARHVEALGFESFYAPEHIALYPGAAMRGVSMPPTVPIADPLQILGQVAAVTERIVLGTAVLLIPYHHPVALAKRLATLDLLSKGRMRLLTVGVGALEGEASAVGVDFASRGRRANEVVDALRLLWNGGADGVSFDGEFIRFESACSFPKPHETTELPIHVGGSSMSAARRAGARGDGYFPGGMLGPAERQRQWQAVREIADEHGRDVDALEYTRWGSTEMSTDRVARMEDEGVTRIVVSAGAGDDLQVELDVLSAFADRMTIRRDSR